MAEAMGDQQSPVPVVLGVGLCVAGDQQDGRVDIPALVEDAQVQLEVRPVVRQRVDYLLKALRKRHRAGA